METKYFVLEITTVNGTTAKAVWEQPTLDAAKMQFHQIMASAYANENCTYALPQIIDDWGSCQVSEIKPTFPEPDAQSQSISNPHNECLPFLGWVLTKKETL